MKILATYHGLHGVAYHRLIVPHRRMYNNGHIAKPVEVVPVGALPHGLDSFDIFVYNRFIEREKVDTIRQVRRAGLKIVVDVDDYWRLPAWHQSAKAYKENKLTKKILEAIEGADLVTCATETLKESIWRECRKKAVVIPNAIEPLEPMWQQPKEKNSVLTFGYIGSHYHLADCATVMPAVHAALETGKCKFVVCVGCNTKDEIFQDFYRMWTDNGRFKDRVEFLDPMEVTQYGAMYANFDVALAMTNDNKFNNHKSELKMMEASAYKLPLVAMGKPYEKHRDHIYYCEDVPQFKEALQYYIDCPHCAVHDGKEQADYVNEWYTIDKVVAQRAEAYKGLLCGRVQY